MSNTDPHRDRLDAFSQTVLNKLELISVEIASLQVRFDRVERDIERRVDDLERRVRDLDRWRFYSLGAIAAVAVIAQAVMR